jgi:hypothetical protein
VDGRGLAPLSTSPTRVGPLAACGGARLPSALAARSARAPRLHDHARGVLEAEREGEGAARPHGDPPADLELTLRRGPCSSGRFSHGGEGRRSRRLGQVALLGDAAERGRARPLPAAPASAVRYPVPPRHERLLRRARVRRVERPTADDVRRLSAGVGMGEKVPPVSTYSAAIIPPPGFVRPRSTTAAPSPRAGHGRVGRSSKGTRLQGRGSRSSSSRSTAARSRASSRMHRMHRCGRACFRRATIARPVMALGQHTRMRVRSAGINHATTPNRRGRRDARGRQIAHATAPPTNRSL